MQGRRNAGEWVVACGSGRVNAALSCFVRAGLPETAWPQGTRNCAQVPGSDRRTPSFHFRPMQLERAHASRSLHLVRAPMPSTRDRCEALAAATTSARRARRSAKSSTRKRRHYVTVNSPAKSLNRKVIGAAPTLWPRWRARREIGDPAQQRSRRGWSSGQIRIPLHRPRFSASPPAGALLRLRMPYCT